MYYTEIEFKRKGSDVHYILPLFIKAESIDEALELIFGLKKKIETTYLIESQ